MVDDHDERPMCRREQASGLRLCSARVGAQAEIIVVGRSREYVAISKLLCIVKHPVFMNDSLDKRGLADFLRAEPEPNRTDASGQRRQGFGMMSREAGKRRCGRPRIHAPVLLTCGPNAVDGERAAAVKRKKRWCGAGPSRLCSPVVAADVFRRSFLAQRRAACRLSSLSCACLSARTLLVSALRSASSHLCSALPRPGRPHLVNALHSAARCAP
jgi:hypothetical protein